MKIYRFLLAAVCCFATAVSLHAQGTIEITGTVTDGNGHPVIGANVVVKNQPGLGTSTNAQGIYTIRTGEYETLMFSFLGYETQEVPIVGRTAINVVLAPGATTMDEVTVVAAGTQRRASVVGAITNVEVEQLNMPSANLSNMLAGNVPGIIAIQRSGEPGQNRSEFWIRGISTFGANSSALVLVDGIERNFDEVNPEDIESFSVLKDASATAIYGQRGANGVVLITTKKGAEGRVKINFKAEYGINQPTKMPSYLNARDYTTLANEARLSRNQSILYDEQDMEIIRYNLDPDLFPNVNWRNELLKNTTDYYKANISLSGGGTMARYYVSGQYQNEGGIYKTSNLNDYNTNANYRRYNYRMNFDMNITKTTLLEAGVAGWVAEQNKPGIDHGDRIWEAMAYMSPVSVPIQYSNGQWPGYGTDGREISPYVQINEMGFRSVTENKIETNLGIKQDLGFITKGLTFTARYSYDSYYKNETGRTKKPAIYRAERVRDGQGNLITTRVSDKQDMFISVGTYGEKRSYFETMLNYDRNFNDRHRVGALLYYYQQGINYDKPGATIFEAVPKRNLALSGRATYAFDDRYFIEFNFGYTGSENFEPGERFGFFPAIAGGWMVSNERFIKDNAPWLNLFKIRYSYGEVGNDQILNNQYDANTRVRFPFVTITEGASGYNFGNNGSIGRGGIRIGTMGASGLTWEVARKHNLGIDLGLFHKFTLTADVFKDTRSNIFLRRTYMPSTAGIETVGQQPFANTGKMENKGIDATMSFQQQIGEVHMTLRGNFLIARTKVLSFDESPNTLPYQKTTGYRWGQNTGLIALGFFKDEEEIANSPTQFGTQLMPGDIKYKDVNGDGVIDMDDVVPIGKTADPAISYGMGMSLVWRSFDFNILFTGLGQRDYCIEGFGVYPYVDGEFGNTLSYAAKESNRWIPREISGMAETERDDAIFPRLAYGSHESNYKHSTFWLRNMRVLRLKNLEIGYTLPREATRKIRIDRLRVYVMGNNICFWSPFNWWDPELVTGNGTRYPLMRSFTAGINLTF